MPTSAAVCGGLARALGAVQYWRGVRRSQAAAAPRLDNCCGEWLVVLVMCVCSSAGCSLAHCHSCFKWLQLYLEEVLTQQQLATLRLHWQ